MASRIPTNRRRGRPGPDGPFVWRGTIGREFLLALITGSPRGVADSVFGESPLGLFLPWTPYFFRIDNAAHQRRSRGFMAPGPAPPLRVLEGVRAGRSRINLASTTWPNVHGRERTPCPRRGRDPAPRALRGIAAARHPSPGGPGDGVRLRYPNPKSSHPRGGPRTRCGRHRPDRHRQDRCLPTPDPGAYPGPTARPDIRSRSHPDPRARPPGGGISEEARALHEATRRGGLRRRRHGAPDAGPPRRRRDHRRNAGTPPGSHGPRLRGLPTPPDPGPGRGRPDARHGVPPRRAEDPFLPAAGPPDDALLGDDAS